MSDVINGKPNSTFWMVGGAALIWNLIGLVFYYSHVTMTPDALEGFTPAQQEFFSSTPVWATSAYAIAVTAGVLGSLLLLFRKAWAVPLFILSLVGVIVQDFNAFVLQNGLEVWGTSGAYLPAIVLVIAVALILYARSARSRHWLD